MKHWHHSATQSLRALLLVFCGVKNNMNKWHNFEPYCRKWVNLVLDAFLLNPTSCIMRLIFCSLQKVFVIRFCGICQLTFEYKGFLHMPGGWCWHSWILVTFKFPYMYTALMPSLIREEKLQRLSICIWFVFVFSPGHWPAIWKFQERGELSVLPDFSFEQQIMCHCWWFWELVQKVTLTLQINTFFLLRRWLESASTQICKSN